MNYMFYSDKEIFQKYMNDIKQYKILDSKEQIKLVKKAQEGDEDARNILVFSNIRFVIKIVERYKNSGISMQELVSEGSMGVFEAIDKFDSTKMNNFISYAVWWIKYYIVRYIQKHSNSIRLPVNRIRDLIKINKLEKLYTNGTLNSSEVLDKVSKELEISKENISALKTISSGMSSLDMVIGLEEDRKVTQADVIEDYNMPNPYEAFESSESIKMLYDCLLKIPKRESEIISKRHGLYGQKPMSLHDLGKEYKLTKERIRQLEIKGMRRIKKMLKRQYFQVAA